MIISPPFLPARIANETEDEWIDRCMVGGEPGQGAFPVSFNLGWHGGIHLTAPMNGDQSEPVRAIADGEVVFMRHPTLQSAGPLLPTHPQAYRGGWTDNGVVIIRHLTEIGEGANATVTFFSIYMHLSEIDPAIRQGRNIYRKARLGVAGQIYGALERTVHFEIVCDDANLLRLIGRETGELNTNTDGRSDSVFGEMYFHLPAGTEVFAQLPLPNHSQAMTQPPPLRGQPTSVLRELQPVHTTTEELFVGLRYSGGEGAQGNRGDAYLTTYRLDGTTLGVALEDNDAEYDLYRTANRIANTYPATERPAPSAVYELLRFGRVIGPDVLNPARVPHWQKVRYPGGQGWVNLNAQSVHKFSDADAPQWKDWTLIDDSADRDSRCDSEIIRGWLDENGDGMIVTSEVIARLGNAIIRRKLERAICKFSTEWSATTIDERWGWLRTQSGENPNPLTGEDFEALRQHIAALAFWPEGIGIDANHWHWQPREFIRHFRQCGWLSLNELCQLLPRRHGANRAALTEIPWSTAQNRFRAYHTELNRTLRKYSIQNAARQTHFLAQTYIETAMWRTMEEIGRAHQQRRRNGTWYWPAPAMEFYQAFYGRGIMQLTWANNYDAYGKYRVFANEPRTHAYSDPRITPTSLHYWSDPRDRTGRIEQPPRQWFPRFDPASIAEDAYSACDSGGHYWTSKNLGRGLRNINRVCDEGVTANAIGRVSVLVNGGGYGFAERQAYASFILRYRGDSMENGTDSSFNVTYGTRMHVVYVDFAPQRPR